MNSTIRAGDDDPSASDAVDVGTCTTKNKFRMVALDLDGTLLNAQHQISNATAEYLRYLYTRGFTVAIATGRAAPSVYEHIIKLNLGGSAPIPLVCSNGSQGLLLCRQETNDDDNGRDGDDAKEGSSSSSSSSRTGGGQVLVSIQQELFYTPVPASVARSAIRLAQNLGHCIQYYHGDYIYANPQRIEHERLLALYAELTGSKQVVVQDSFESLLVAQQLPSKLLILFDEVHMERVWKAVEIEFASNGSADDGQKHAATATIVRGAYDWFVEVLAPSCNKGHGLVKLCQALDVPLEQCLAFGDGHNDVEFLQLAGHGIAMKNGAPEVQKVADDVTKYTNDQNGVRKALEQLEQDGKLVVC